MAKAEERIDKLEVRFSTLEQQVSAVVAKVDMVITELQQQREDIRRSQEKHDADIKGTLKHIQNLIIAAVVGIAVITVATWVFMWTTANNLAQQHQPPAQFQQTEPYQAAK